MHAVENTSPPNHKELMNFVFANRSEETAIYPLTVREIAEDQTKDKTLEKLTLLKKYKPQLIFKIFKFSVKMANLSSQGNYKASSRMVSPILATPRYNTPRIDSLCCDVLERLITFCLHLVKK